jgi:hypothetical protein
MNRVCGVIVSMLTSSAVDREVGPRSGKTQDYKIGICCFSAKHSALRKRERPKTGWLKIRITCLVGVKQQSLTHSQLNDLFYSVDCGTLYI